MSGMYDTVETGTTFNNTKGNFNYKRTGVPKVSLAIYFRCSIIKYIITSNIDLKY